jgi:hypothetical protein
MNTDEDGLSNEDSSCETKDAASTVSDDDMSIAEDLCIASIELSFHSNQQIVMRMNWYRHCQLLLHKNLFHVKYQMPFESINKLLDMRYSNLQLKEKYAKMSGTKPISCEIMLHCTLRYLAGGSYHDIRVTASITKASFYRLVWHTINVINNCTSLDIKLPTIEQLPAIREGFKSISRDGIMDGCIGALDGYLMRITAPSFAECGNVGAYFSGHYCTYGVNVQAMCDTDCRFIFLCLAAPGKTNDSVAIRKTSLPAWLDALPPGYFTAADCAYSITEHLVAPYSGPLRYIEAYEKKKKKKNSIDYLKCVSLKRREPLGASSHYRVPKD